MEGSIETLVLPPQMCPCERLKPLGGEKFGGKTLREDSSRLPDEFQTKAMTQLLSYPHYL